ncbi:hypothetical protein Daudx_1480 [Candidatus Desulforudis audaxviator]|nr:hypothetical protein Daudx_1480 [Candidatus Desulforudis audaxviator]
MWLGEQPVPGVGVALSGPKMLTTQNAEAKPFAMFGRKDK